MKSPQIWMIAGPNGSGKTSLVTKYITRFKETITKVGFHKELIKCLLPIVNYPDIWQSYC